MTGGRDGARSEGAHARPQTDRERGAFARSVGDRVRAVVRADPPSADEQARRPRSGLLNAAPGAHAPGPRRALSSQQALKLLVTAVVVAGILFAFVFPVRTYLAQQRTIRAAAARVQILDEQDARLSARADQLQTDAEIERLARQDYGMVKPGEEPYAILPAPGSKPAGLPSIVDGSPTSPKKHPNLVHRLLDDLTFWN